jgi:hypothetical protein
VIDALLLLSAAAFILAGSVVGARLLRASARSRELPDFIVGLSLFVLSAIAYPLILLGSAGELSLEAAKLVTTLSTAALVLGWAGVFVFTQRVFRPGESWAVALASAGVAALLYGLAAGVHYFQGAADRAALASSESPALWVVGAAVIAYAWTALEGFRCWAQARRRLRIGLADPLVVNRFLLWGWVGIASLLSTAPSLAITLAGGNGATSVAARLCTVIGGLAAALALQLAFLPPAAYRRWVSGAAAA